MSGPAEATTRRPSATATWTADCADAARAAVDEDRVTARDASSRSTRSDVSPATPAAAATAQSIDDARRPGVQYGELRVGVLTGAEDLVAHGHARHPFADLVDNPGRVEAEEPGAVGGFAAGHGLGQQLPIERVDADRADGDTYLAGPGARLGSLCHLELLGPSIGVILQCEHRISFARGLFVP